MIDWHNLPEPLPEDGLEVKVRATFGGLRFLPRLFAFGKNNRNPSLKVFSDHLELKIMGTTSVDYDKIQVADGRVYGKTHNVTLTSKGKLGRPTANIRNRDDLVGLLRFLEQRGVPLTKKAAMMVTESD